MKKKILFAVVVVNMMGANRFGGAIGNKELLTRRDEI